MSQPEAPARPPAGPPPDRYGRRDPVAARRRAVIGGGVVVVLLLAWAGWVAARQAATPVRWQSGAFSAPDDGHATLTFRVTTDPGRPVVCTVRMFNSGLTEVGRSDVVVGPSTSRTFTSTVTIPTFEAAASGQIRACAVR